MIIHETPFRKRKETMTVTFTLSKEEIAEALEAYVIEKHPQFKGQPFKPTRQVPSYSFQIGGDNKTPKKVKETPSESK